MEEFKEEGINILFGIILGVVWMMIITLLNINPAIFALGALAYTTVRVIRFQDKVNKN